MPTAAPRSPYRPRRLRVRDGREVTLRAIAESDAPAIARAFEQLSPDSRYQRFMQHKKQLNPVALERGVRRGPGDDFAFVAAVPRGEGAAGPHDSAYLFDRFVDVLERRRSGDSDSSAWGNQPHSQARSAARPIHSRKAGQAWRSDLLGSMALPMAKSR